MTTPNLSVRGGSWYNDREPYHRATHQATSTKGRTIGFRTFRPSRLTRVMGRVMGL